MNLTKFVWRESFFRRICVASLSVFALAMVRWNAAAEGSADLTNIQTQFVERGVLTTAEVSNVVELAKQCGLRDAVSVRTYYIMPITEDWNFGIEVKGAEIVSGRRIACVTVQIYQHAYESPRVMKSLGHYWVAQGGVRTNEFASFVVNHRTVRVEMPSTLSLTTADRIIAAFSAGRVHLENDNRHWPQALKRYDFSAPDELTGPQEDGRYTARIGSYHGCKIEFDLEGDTVRILSVSLFMT